ncbi:MAG: Hsp20/alpha crystallin family protein [Deltaproteobacteria bacterium]|nr:Hsp20/alpha crystallin family protein [Deltaproteobacteria bacterium]
MLNELVRWEPFSEELSSWHRDIDDLFGRFFGRPEPRLTGGLPPMETFKKEGNYVIRVDLPGVDPKDLDVHVEGNLLTIKAERKSEEKGPEYRETFYGKFERAVTLPHGVKSEKMTARYENGVLELVAPLPAELAGRKIPIQIESTKKLESKAA